MRPLIWLALATTGCHIVSKEQYAEDLEELFGDDSAADDTGAPDSDDTGDTDSDSDSDSDSNPDSDSDSSTDSDSDSTDSGACDSGDAVEASALGFALASRRLVYLSLYIYWRSPVTVHRLLFTVHRSR